MRLVVIALVLVVVLVAALLGVASGVTIDNDTYALQESFRSILGGDYRASRTTGFPAYEYLGAMVFSLGSVKAVMMASAAFTLAGLSLLIRPSKALTSWLGLACWASLALSPMVLTNASALMETALLLFGVSLMAFAFTFEGLARPTGNLAAVLISVLVTLIRPDAALFCAAMALAVAFSARPVRVRMWLASALVTGTVIGLVLLVAITQQSSLQNWASSAEPLTRRLLRGGVGLNTVMTPIGAVALGVLVLMLAVATMRLVSERRGVASAQTAASFFSDQGFVGVLLLASIVFYGIRFLLLADEVEYLLPLMIVLAIAIPNLGWAGKRVWIPGLIVVGSAGLTSVVTVSLLQRGDPWDREPIVAASLQPGGFIQDLAMRQASGVRSSKEYATFLAASEGSLRDGLETGRIALVPQDTWHYVLSDAYGAYYESAEAIASCDAMTADTLVPGWRVSQPAATYRDLVEQQEGRLMGCGIVASVTADGLIPTQYGATESHPAGIMIPQ